MRKKQCFDNSCGAAALLCAAGELGVNRVPELQAEPAYVEQQLVANNNCEAAIYRVTCGSTLGERPINVSLEQGGYSLPHNVVLAAKLLGLDARVYLERGFYSWALTLLYSPVVRLCEQSGVQISRRTPPPLMPNERMLRVVGVRMGTKGLHWVMRRSNGSYMDPADGVDYMSFRAMNSWERSYADTGVSIVLRKDLGHTLLARRIANDAKWRAPGRAAESPI